MPRDLFGDVTKPSIKIGNRKWYSVPVSLGSHLLVIAMIALIPILAPALLPMPDSSLVYAIRSVEPPKPPPPPVRADSKPTPIVNPNAAPTMAPTGITPEVSVEPGFESDNAVDIVIGDTSDGLPPDIVLAAPPRPVAPVRVGGMIRPPVKINDVPLVYPAIAQAARVQGMVIIEAVIGTDGRVTNAKILRSVPLLDQAALEAVKTWEYTPTLLNGIPVAVIMTIVVQFQLQR